MAEISKSVEVLYSADEMYTLVNDIESYPSFLPWCNDTRVFRQSDRKLSATLELAIGRIRQSFSTENTMEPGRLISMRLIKGPFKQLAGTWKFDQIDNNKCRVELHMHFEFKNRILKLSLEGIFNRIMDTLVESFVNRAIQVYGQRQED